MVRISSGNFGYKLFWRYQGLRRTVDADICVEDVGDFVDKFILTALLKILGPSSRSWCWQLCWRYWGLRVAIDAKSCVEDCELCRAIAANNSVEDTGDLSRNLCYELLEMVEILLCLSFIFCKVCGGLFSFCRPEFFSQIPLHSRKLIIFIVMRMNCDSVWPFFDSHFGRGSSTKLFLKQERFAIRCFV